MSIRANSYFSGAGLMEIGLLRGGIEVQQSFEMDPKCCATQRANFTQRAGTEDNPGGGCEFKFERGGHSLTVSIQVQKHGLTQRSPRT